MSVQSVVTLISYEFHLCQEDNDDFFNDSAEVEALNAELRAQATQGPYVVRSAEPGRVCRACAPLPLVRLWFSASRSVMDLCCVCNEPRPSEARGRSESGILHFRTCLFKLQGLGQRECRDSCQPLQASKLCTMASRLVPGCYLLGAPFAGSSPAGNPNPKCSDVCRPGCAAEGPRPTVGRKTEQQSNCLSTDACPATVRANPTT